jgi:hypothetical protein
MNRLYISFVIFFLLLFSLSFVSSKFVCGYVNNSMESSSDWAKVIVYPDLKPLSFIECKVNPEHKFCCDLWDNVSSVGNKITAEVFDGKAGFVAGPVSLLLTEEGYDIFPLMNIQNAITINSPNESIFINQSLVSVNISLSESYNNLNYIINSSQGFSEVHLCTNCNTSVFFLPINKGKNDINLIAYNNNRKISKNLTFYNLDYLNFNINAYCDKCKLKGNILYVPSGKDIQFYSFFNASHNISGDFLFYFPLDWNLSNSSNEEDFSLTHKILSEDIKNKKDFSFNYTLQSPSTLLKEEYSFFQEIGNQKLETKVMVFRSRLIPFHKSKPFQYSYLSNILIQRGSPDEPIVLNSKQDYLKLVAIFPKEEILKSYSTLSFDETRRGSNKEYFFTILTSISKNDIDKIMLIFKTEKGKSIEVYSGKYKIYTEFYEEDSNYTYYSAFVNEKGPFSVKIF